MKFKYFMEFNSFTSSKKAYILKFIFFVKNSFSWNLKWEIFAHNGFDENSTLANISNIEYLQYEY